MAKNVNLNKDVFNKNTYPKVIDTKFKSLGTKTIADQVAEVSTPQEFFNMLKSESNKNVHFAPQLQSNT